MKQARFRQKTVYMYLQYNTIKYNKIQYNLHYDQLNSEIIR